VKYGCNLLSANVEYTHGSHTHMSLVAVLAPRAGKIIKNVLSVFERGESLLQNGILLHFVFRFSQSSEITLKSYEIFIL